MSRNLPEAPVLFNRQISTYMNALYEYSHTLYAVKLFTAVEKIWDHTVPSDNVLNTLLMNGMQQKPLKSKKKGNDQALIQLHSTSHPQSQDGKKHTHKKIDKHSRMTRTVNRMNSSFPNRWSFSYPN